jgi:hypothetical protein
MAGRKAFWIQTDNCPAVRQTKERGSPLIIFKNPVRTAKKTTHFTITKLNWLTLFKEIIAVCTENQTKPMNTK